MEFYNYGWIMSNRYNWEPSKHSSLIRQTFIWADEIMDGYGFYLKNLKTWRIKSW